MTGPKTTVTLERGGAETAPSATSSKRAASVISTVDKLETLRKHPRSLANPRKSREAELVNIKMQKPFPSKFPESLNSAHGPHEGGEGGWYFLPAQLGL